MKMFRMKNTLYKTHQPDIEELFFKQKEFNEDYQIVKQKILRMEDKLPKMIREMINYYFD